MLTQLRLEDAVEAAGLELTPATRAGRALERRGGEGPEALRARLGKIRLRVPARPAPEVLTRDELDRVRAAAGELGAWFQLAVSVAAFTGVRRQELRHLHAEDFDLDARVLRVSRRSETKSRRERAVPLCRELVLALRAAGLPRTGPIFPALTAATVGAYVSDDLLKTRLGQLAARTGVRLTWHKFRRTFATLALRGGADVATVASWLGHAPGDGALLLRHYAGVTSGYSPAIEGVTTARREDPRPSPAPSVLSAASALLRRGGVR